MISLDEATHTYRETGGTRVPGVTEILEASGVSTPPVGVDPEVWIAAQVRGTAVHRLTALEDAGGEIAPDGDTIGPIQAWRQYKSRTRMKILEREKLVYHPVFRYAGTLDVLCELWVDGRWQLFLLDLKTGQKRKAHRIQTALYSMALAQEYGAKSFPRRGCVYLGDDGEPKFDEHADPGDYGIAQAAVTIAAWRLQG
jgi:hypothetical protein